MLISTARPSLSPPGGGELIGPVAQPLVPVEGLRPAHREERVFDRRLTRLVPNARSVRGGRHGRIVWFLRKGMAKLTGRARLPVARASNRSRSGLTSRSCSAAWASSAGGTQGDTVDERLKYLVELKEAHMIGCVLRRLRLADLSSLRSVRRGAAGDSAL